MKSVDFSQEGGFPLTQFTLEHMQSAYNDELLAAMMAWLARRNMFGAVEGSDRMIITGIDQVLDQFTPGWIIIDGELLFFEGASEVAVKASGIGTQTIMTSALFKDNTSHDVYKYKRAVVGGDDPVPVENYRRAPNLASLRPILAFSRKQTLPGLGAGIPTSYDVPAIGARKNDAVAISVIPDNAGYMGWFTASGVVPSDDLVRVTVTNLYSGMEVPSVDVEFKIRVIK